MVKTKHPNRSRFLAELKSAKIKKNVIEAFESVPQESFFEQAFSRLMYTPESVPIGSGERSDPPMALAMMLGRLSPQHRWRVLEVGTGSGYSTAVLSRLVREVVTVEIREELAAAAKRRLQLSRISNARVFAGDGTEYERALGQFDAVVVLAGCRKRPLSVLRSVKSGGRMVFPMGPEHQQQIALLTNRASEDGEEMFHTSFHEYCIFTPLQGRYGWA
jgi:protein-L-isoaspartate(D-aspartate) O-methyltransferase